MSQWGRIEVTPKKQTRELNTSLLPFELFRTPIAGESKGSDTFTWCSPGSWPIWRLDGRRLGCSSYYAPA